MMIIRSSAKRMPAPALPHGEAILMPKNIQKKLRDFLGIEIFREIIFPEIRIGGLQHVVPNLGLVIHPHHKSPVFFFKRDITKVSPVTLCRGVILQGSPCV